MSTRMIGSLGFSSLFRPRFTPICLKTHTAATSRSAPTAAENPLLCPRFRDASPLQRVEMVKVGRHLQSPKLDVDDLTDWLQGLTCAVQDMTIVARALAALEKPFARDARSGGDQAAVADDPSVPKLGIREQLFGPDLKEKLFRDLMTMENLPLLMSTSILDAVKLLWDNPDLKLTKSGPTDFRRHFSLVRECGKSQISSSIAAPQTLATVVAIEFEDFELKYNKEGLRIYTDGLAGLQVMSQKRGRSSFPGGAFRRL
ncbi:hypothetical protein MVLG_06658 [Microbotryum lychnidis-dioicae p1A1 Lamole]|uniref:Uncharacterized protein n=1 Tax=Microbotryum lychnidis-dioicae (strain p1A1 Lamole / MvSl-1064) TaxID=683840 RepID=U5HHY8_USTV1|nr:hypothetical protein MVLG_06658 [Microbotryum lychnidis-dioicae p1A1 Lamole]|eukprot:KDE02799.1 hypothetical protein MVLG_06658 [Microbotryum lychnidis-dioicae p1A1 Lamole]